jgi:demethylmenaquinone methyltransferase/2-methoxy-6-polyprenyl-1,4-benzoquinol methylase
MQHDVIKPYHSDASKTEEVAEMFDNIAPKYDFLNRIFSLRIDTLWRKKLIAELKSLQPKTILDVATGTADLAINAAASIPDASITGIDISKEMLAFGKKKVLSAQLADRVRLEVGNAQALHFPDGSFDAVMVAFGVRNFENLDAGISEMHRVLKSEGKLFILEFSNPQYVIIRWLYYFYFCNVLPIIGKWISKDARAYTYLPESVKAFPSGDAMKKILLQNGFKSVECTTLTFGISTLYIASL